MGKGVFEGMMSHQFMYPKVTPVSGGGPRGASGTGAPAGTSDAAGSRRSA